MPISTRFAVLFLLSLGAAGSIAYWLWQGREAQLRDAADESLPCLSYSPFRRPDQSPHIPKLVISPSQIEADLAILSRRTDCVRIYSVDNGQSEVPRLARKFGMKVILGLWIGRDPKKNEEEIERGLKIIQRDSDAIRAVMVGNEVLLRREQTPEQLRRHIDRVREATTLPVSYADVWEYWTRHAEVAQSVSFITVHILPYWEDEPAPIDRAVEHVLWAYQKMQDTFPGRDILIGETGWPSAGRNRHGAAPGLVNQARFIREFGVAALKERIQYNVIEAFDQPWKRKDEGTVGGHWGMYSAEGEEKFPFIGPVTEEPLWLNGISAAALGAALLLGLGLLRRPLASRMELGVLAAGGAISGAVAMAQWFAFERGALGGIEWVLLGIYTLCVPWAGIRLSQAFARWMESGHTSRPAPLAGFVRWFNTNARTYRSIERALGVLRFVFLFGAALVCLLLTANPRYRDFPLALYALPACGFFLLAWLDVQSAHFADDIRPYAEAEERLLALWLMPSALFITVREGWANHDAQYWALLCLLLALSVLWPDRWLRRLREARQSQHGQQQPHS